jgi:hypothetical protein
MTITLRDPTDHRFSPSTGPSSDVAAETKLIAPRTLADELLTGSRRDGAASGTTFELESHGGYAHTVTGTIAYLDEEARTFMVRELDGRLTPVPLRDVTSARTISGEREPGPGPDAQGLGTGIPRSTSQGGRAG